MNISLVYLPDAPEAEIMPFRLPTQQRSDWKGMHAVRVTDSGYIVHGFSDEIKWFSPLDGQSLNAASRVTLKLKTYRRHQRQL